MGFIDDLGHAFESAGQTIKNTAESAGGAIAGAATKAGTTISDTATAGANTVATGVVNATEAALEAMDPERKKQRERMQQAQQEWSRLDNEANEALKAAQVQSQAQIPAELNPIKAQADTLHVRLTQYLGQADTIHTQLQTKVEQDYTQAVLNLNSGLAGLTRLAMILRGHSVEEIREAKLEQGGDMDPNDFLLRVIDGSQKGFSDAMNSASTLLSLVGDLTVQVRDLDQGEIPTLLADMASFGEFSSKTITAQRQSAATAQKAIDDLQKNVQEQKQEVADHLHMNMTDDLAGIGKAILDTFGASFPDDKWEEFLQSHYINIQSSNKDIVQNQTTAAVANGIVEQATPILETVNKLQQQTANTLASLEALAPQLESLKANLNEMRIQVDDMAKVFTTLSESKHLTVSTALYVKKLGQIGATSFRVDACCSSFAGAMFAQLTQIAIPQPASNVITRNSTAPAEDVQKEVSAEWEAALALPLQCSLPPIDGKQHEHFTPEVQDRTGALMQEVIQADQKGIASYYTP
ncbi:hypothetical protein A1O7_05842 [Cladophialophora yegresii CBS 114405]|uniref:Uncharacterized protein n=1 Tax=Cladophialophora yegresii CBS 114405 TaxID=1182544 RepID=W9VRT6_9EURO|nr:uncharacterized protein A1O7_05842 [Cladophialophora yegresii CBS 114405]EXJ58417.1 hypothetical protein A1O7_05842 [Cladophialophora yegresii CBS 114405]